MSAEGGPAAQVTKQGGFAAFESLDGRFIYYAKGLNANGLWRVRVDGGEEAPVLEFPKAGYWGYWALADKGIYFVNTICEAERARILRLCHASNQARSQPRTTAAAK